MKEIKFRAWYVPTQSWHYWTLLELADDPIAVEDYTHWTQYTTYLDMDGNPIYEGDIVQRTRGGKPFSVRWSDRGWSLGWNIQTGNKIKVIGERFHNQDLLPI